MGFLIQAGDVVKGNGHGGECIFGGQFEDESLDGIFDLPGLVAMANGGVNTNSSQFFITTKPARHLDRRHVIVGRVVRGMEVVSQVETLPVTEDDTPQKRVHPCLPILSHRLTPISSHPHPIPSHHIIPHHPIPIPSHTILPHPAQPIRPDAIPSHPAPPILSDPIRSQPIPSHPVPPHPIRSRPI